MNIEEIRIRGLHGRWNVQIPIRDNRLILVGLNGRGKTTIISMLYYFLSRQWRRLAEFRFEDMVIVVAADEITIRRDDLKFVHLDQRQFDHLAASKVLRDYWVHSNQMVLWDDAKKHAAAYEYLQQVNSGGDVSPSLVQYMLSDFDSSRHKKRRERVRRVEAKLAALSGSQLLYLPTYRRIEQDLKTIFPNVEIDIAKKVNSVRNKRPDGDVAHVEFVEFGMSDVETAIKGRLDQIKEKARQELNALAGSYLRDVIRGSATEWNSEAIRQLSDDDARRIISRVEEHALTDDDRQRILAVIVRIRAGEDLHEWERYLAHYFSRLIDIHFTQLAEEGSIRSFIGVCNRYLHDKQFVYDDTKFTLTLDLEHSGSVSLSSLSSGEKQIVSLFSHIHLLVDRPFLVIIDEPELSLSTEWQQTFLPDVLETGRCQFLAAVTHSPFIYDNALAGHAVDVSRFLSQV